MGIIILIVITAVAVALFLRYRSFMGDNPLPAAFQTGVTFTASPSLSQQSIEQVSKTYQFFAEGQQVLVHTKDGAGIPLYVFTLVDIGAPQLAVPMFQGPIQQYGMFGNPSAELGWISPQQSIILNFVPPRQNVASQLTYTALKFPVDPSIKEYVFLVRPVSTSTTDPWRIYRLKPDKIVSQSVIVLPALDSLPTIDTIGDEATLKYVNKRIDAVNDEFNTLPGPYE